MCLCLICVQHSSFFRLSSGPFSHLDASGKLSEGKYLDNLSTRIQVNWKYIQNAIGIIREREITITEYTID